jgi:hypothetical protein
VMLHVFSDVDPINCHFTAGLQLMKPSSQWIGGWVSVLKHACYAQMTFIIRFKLLSTSLAALMRVPYAVWATQHILFA